MRRTGSRLRRRVVRGLPLRSALPVTAAKRGRPATGHGAAMGVRLSSELLALLADAALAETKRTGKHVTVSDILRVGGEKEARRVLRR